MKDIVLIIDWQNWYGPEHRKISKTYWDKAVKNTAAIIHRARARGDDVVWIAFTKSDDVFKNNPKSFVPELAALREPNDLLFLKLTSDAFANENFKKWIGCQNFNRLIFTGFHINDCVRATILGAIYCNLGSKIVLARNACAPALVDNRNKEWFSQLITNHGGSICSTERLLTHSDPHTPIKNIPLLEKGELDSCNAYIKCKEIQWNADPIGIFDAYIEHIWSWKGPSPFRARTPELAEHLMQQWAKTNKVAIEDLKAIKERYTPELYAKIAGTLRQSTPCPA